MGGRDGDISFIILFAMGSRGWNEVVGEEEMRVGMIFLCNRKGETIQAGMKMGRVRTG